MRIEETAIMSLYFTIIIAMFTLVESAMALHGGAFIALSYNHGLRHRAASPKGISTCSRLSASNHVDAEDLSEEELDKLSKREIVVSASINLPFSADVAFSAFADLTRQPSWSPWLYSVSYIEEKASEITYTECGIPLLETKWVLQWKKALRFSWKSKVRKFERPNMIQWESTSGLKNMGQIIFTEHGSNKSDGQDLNTDMLLEMKFVAPRVVASLMKRSDKISNFMENKMLNPTLANFRNVVMEEDLGISPMKEGHDD